ncbi:MAG: OmpA family protein [Bacteroidota bacterium]
MSKLVPSISGIACFLWVVIWSWWLSEEHSSQLDSQNKTSTSIQVADQDSVFRSDAVFSFHLSDEKPVLPEESLVFFKRIANYLKNNQDRVLTLTGSYLPLPHERNQSEHPNLGIARANAIKLVLLGEEVDPEVIRVAAQEVQHHLTIEGRIVGGVDFEFSEKQTTVETERTASDTGGINPEKSTTKKNDDGLNGKQVALFKYDYKEYALERRNRTKLDELRRLIRSNPSYRLNITGYSTSDEEKAKPGLAKQRAMAVRRYLVDTGVRRRNILPESQPGAAELPTDRRVEITLVK